MASRKAGFILLLVLFCNKAFSQVPYPDTTTISKYGFHNELTTGQELSYFIDPDKSIDFPQVQTKEFTVPQDVFLKEFKINPRKKYFWVRFSIQNNTDSAIHPFLYCGDINYLTLYLIANGRLQQKVVGGNLQNLNKNIPEEEQTYSILRLNLAPRQSGMVYIKMIQKTEESLFNGIGIYKKDVLYNTIESDYYQNKNDLIWSMLFQGFVIFQILYILFQWLIIRRKEYLYYFFYLVTILLYFLSKQEAELGESFLFSRYPVWSVYLNKTLQIAPYFLYYRFIRYFLEIDKNHPVLNKWIIRIEYFLLAYLVFDFIFITTTFNTKLQTLIFTYTLSLVFIATASFIIYLLRKKQTLIYFVLSGSLAVGLGNILGVVFSYLRFEKHIQLNIDSALIFSEIGIVIEMICFTAGLSYKNRLIEKEKLISQENLIKQLKENQLLNSKMLNIRNKISLDLHDEIGSTLSSISILSEMALHEKTNTEASAMLEEIKENSISVMEKMDDIVWNINPSNDSMEKLFLRIKTFGAKLFEAKGINYKMNIAENVNSINMLVEYRQHIYLIMKEAINNLVKYSHATEAAILVSYDADLLTIIIKDNGAGYDINQITDGNGVPGMKSRAQEMDAKIEIQSKITEGTTIGLFIKI